MTLRNISKHRFPRIHIIQPLKKNVREIILNRLSEERQSKQAFPLSNLATTQVYTKLRILNLLL